MVMQGQSRIGITTLEGMQMAFQILMPISVVFDAIRPTSTTQ
jgi:hypothetical protein